MKYYIIIAASLFSLACCTKKDNETDKEIETWKSLQLTYTVVPERDNSYALMWEDTLGLAQSDNTE